MCVVHLKGMMNHNWELWQYFAAIQLLDKTGSTIWLSFHVAARWIVQSTVLLQNLYKGYNTAAPRQECIVWGWTVAGKRMLQHNVEEVSKDINWAMQSRV